MALIDPDMGKERFAGVTESLRPDFLFADSKLLEALSHGWGRRYLTRNTPFPESLGNIRKIWRVGAGICWSWKFQNALSKGQRTHSGTEDRTRKESGHTPEIIVFTGGTTGNPKGVVHSLETIGKSLAAIKKRIFPSENQVA